ncbi:MAG TPA: hypothetical protein VMM79_21005 [Longimicrobiales bacterium]|nr:hypothetical protein [Longimicrobiales bacterium]
MENAEDPAYRGRPLNGRRTVVLKFGGTSLAGPARIRMAARRVEAHVRRGHRVVAVVSASGGTTDRILSCLTRCALPAAGTSSAWRREVDRALATGEDRAAAVVAAALRGRGVPAVSLRAGEAGVVGEGDFGEGCIAAVTTERLCGLLADGLVPVVAGYQAVRADGETVTLGRGGSDTSAVALAAALGAACHIVTDVVAIHDRDPHEFADARPIREMEHAQLLQLANAGARVVHPAAALLAASSGVTLRVYHYRSPFAGSGTVVRSSFSTAHASNGGVS